jgi:preprotein translocase subunit YajC
VNVFLNSCLLLAENAAPAADAPADTNAMPRLLMMVAGFGLLMYFFMMRPQKRKENDFRTMIANLKESDHVVTIGGIHGVVTNVQRDAERVTVRVDESTGAKLRFSLSSIAKVITDDDDTATAGKSK